jgi:glycosyltransferase involved in cell wall biosynthesis
MPVSIIEAMKAGVIPIVNNLPGGIQELIINGRTGYKIDQNLPCRFASIIKKLHEDKGLVNYLSEQCSLFANRLFNPIINAAAIEDIMIQSLVKKTTKQPLKVYGSRLDSKYIPNFITTLIRNISIR